MIKPAGGTPTLCRACNGRSISGGGRSDGALGLWRGVWVDHVFTEIEKKRGKKRGEGSNRRVGQANLPAAAPLSNHTQTLQELFTRRKDGGMGVGRDESRANPFSSRLLLGRLAAFFFDDVDQVDFRVVPFHCGKEEGGIICCECQRRGNRFVATNDNRTR